MRTRNRCWIDEDTDMQMSWYLPVNAQLTPDTARWRGHDAQDLNGNANAACGYETPLTVTGASNDTPVVITTSSSCSLSNGQAVLIAGVQGNTAANGVLLCQNHGIFLHYVRALSGLRFDDAGGGDRGVDERRRGEAGLPGRESDAGRGRLSGPHF